MTSSKKGDRRERELVNQLDEWGFAVMRAPASGSATERELPDVLAGDDGDFYAIEAKSSSGKPIYIDAEEVEGLLFFANSFGAKARIAVGFDTEYEDPWRGDDEASRWQLFAPEDLYQTDGGNYRIKKETAIEDGVPLRSIVS